MRISVPDSCSRSLPSKRAWPETATPSLTHPTRAFALPGQQSHDRQAGDGLAATGLADQPGDLALVDLEVDAVDGGRASEGDAQVFDF
ncbi:hypothetical protein GCM10029992_19370 [Glycomyces albus]